MRLLVFSPPVLFICGASTSRTSPIYNEHYNAFGVCHLPNAVGQREMHTIEREPQLQSINQRFQESHPVEDLLVEVRNFSFLMKEII
eukprot:m.117725 g.117725  ORF g.117725 m.117725 type:complete len:87 (+) comp37624_c0_seq14:747-1007(+)